MPRAVAVALLAALAGLVGSAVPAAPAAGFSLHRNVFQGGLDVPATLQQAPRWAAEPVNGTGLHDGISVGVAPGFAAALGATPAEEAQVRDAIVAGFDAWSNAALGFQVTFDADLTSSAYEITLDSYAGPTGLGEVFGFANWTDQWVPGRLLTNGQRYDGWVITDAGIMINAANVGWFRSQFAAILTDEGLLAALQRLVMHEVGHTIGFGHPTIDLVNFDTDFDPLNAMPIDPLAPWTGLFASPNADSDTIMSGLAYGSSFAALFDTALHPDEVGGRDALYPVVPEPAPGLLLGLALTLTLALAPRTGRRRAGGGEGGIRTHG